MNNKNMTYLYLMEFESDTEQFFKIGIAQKGVYYRYAYDKDLQYRFRVLLEIPLPYETALAFENSVKQRYFNYRYNPIYPFGGSKTECFSIQPEIVPENTKTLNKKFERIKDTSGYIETSFGSNIFTNEDFDSNFFEGLKTKIKNSFNFIYIDLRGISDSYRGLLEAQDSGRLFLHRHIQEFSDKYINLLINLQNKLLGKSNILTILCKPETKPHLKGKGYTKYINPDREQYLSEGVILSYSLSSIGILWEYSEEQYGIYKLSNILSEYLRCGKKANIYVFNPRTKQQIEKCLDISIDTLSWKDFIDENRDNSNQ